MVFLVHVLKVNKEEDKPVNMQVEVRDELRDDYAVYTTKTLNKYKFIKEGDIFAIKSEDSYLLDVEMPFGGNFGETLLTKVRKKNLVGNIVRKYKPIKTPQLESELHWNKCLYFIKEPHIKPEVIKGVLDV